MFVTNGEVPIRDNPSLSAGVIGNSAPQQEIPVTGTPALADGLIWHMLDGGGNLWIPEKRQDGSEVFMVWQGAGSAPTVPGSAASPKASPTGITQPASFTHQQLINAFSQAANALGAPDDYFNWINQAGIGYIAENRSAFYSGTPIQDLPNLEDEIKLTVIARLNAIVSGATDTTSSETQRMAIGQGGAMPVAEEVSTVTVASAPQGRFRVDGTRFLLDDTPFRFVGVNLREIAYYGYAPWNSYARPEHVDIQLDAAQAMRAQVIRLYAPYSRMAGGDGTDSSEAVRRIQAILDKLQRRNMFALITLDDGKESGFNVATDNHRYKTSPGGYNTDYYRSGYRDTLRPFIEKVVGALAGHPALFAWGVCNESQVSPYPPTSLSMRDVSEIFYSFYKDVTGLLRQLDPKTLITTSIESCHHLFVEHAYSGANYADKLYTLPTLDFATLHTYRDYQRMDNKLGHGAERVLAEVDRAKNVWHKPVVVEEIGPVGGEHRPDGGAWISDALNELFTLGYAGVMQWGFQATDGDIGVGDGDAGMHKGGAGLPSGDWGSLFSAYQRWGTQFWVD